MKWGYRKVNHLPLLLSYEGYNEKLWKGLGKILGEYSAEDVVFAVETSCDLWKTIVDYLSRQGYTVLLVNPLTTYHSRPLMNHDFSKTDQKDALLIATNAYNGNYIKYKQFTPEINRLHRLSITYEKLTKDRQRAVAQLRAFMEEVFPEYLRCIHIDTETSLYLLEKYFLPERFHSIDIQQEAINIRRISNGNHGSETLLKIREYAKKSIGSRIQEEEETLRLILDSWISEIRQINKSIKAISDAMIGHAKKNEYFDILTSMMGISDISVARFIGECRDLNLYDHYKQIEKFAGTNLRLMNSGKYEGTRRISGIGNKRLLKLIYLMTAQTARFIPEVRIKFLKRQLKKKCYRKNIIASSSQLLKLLMALIKEKRKYVFRKEQNKQKAETTRKAA